MSRPGKLFLLAEIVIAAIVLWLPFSPLQQTLGFVMPSAGLVAVVLVITLLYGVAMEAIKRLFYRYLAY